MSEKVEFVESELPIPFTCIICCDRLNNPVIIPCGHTFCKECISEAFRVEKEKPCPTCKRKLKKGESLVPNINLQQAIGELKVFCTYKEQGCQVKMRLEELESHSKICLRGKVVKEIEVESGKCSDFMMKIKANQLLDKD